MENEITLLRNNNHREWSDKEWIDEFYLFLQGDVPDGIEIRNPVKLSPKKAMSIIWYLQEHFSILPDNIEQCSVCKDLYDSQATGYHSEIKDKLYCGICMPPFIDEKEEKIIERRERKINKSR